jgi:broad specificity phosphatase PhoE
MHETGLFRRGRQFGRLCALNDGDTNLEVKQFEFRLGALLRVRKSLLEAEEQRLQNLIGQQASLKQQRQRIHEEAKEEGESLVRRTAVSGAILACYANYQASARVRSDQITKEIGELDGVIQDQRLKVRKADIQVQVLQRYRDRCFKQWQAEANKEVEQLGAESYLSRFVRERDDPGGGDRWQEV